MPGLSVLAGVKIEYTQTGRRKGGGESVKIEWFSAFLYRCKPKSLKSD